jgi:hypothetical protein
MFCTVISFHRWLIYTRDLMFTKGKTNYAIYRIDEASFWC